MLKNKKLLSNVYPNIEYVESEELYIEELSFAAKQGDSNNFTLFASEEATSHEPSMKRVAHFMDHLNDHYEALIAHLAAVLADPASEEYETVELYISHHLEELDEVALDEIFGPGKALELSQEEMLESLKLKGVSLWEQGGNLTIDLTFDSTFTDYVISIQLDGDDQVVDIAMES